MAAKSSKKPDVAAELATRLVTELAAKKAEGNYPLSLRQLVVAVDREAQPDVVLAAVGKKTFTTTAFLVKPPDKKKGIALQAVMESPVGLWEDAEHVARHPATLAFVRGALAHAAIAEWKKWVNGKAVFKTAFAEVVDEQAPLVLLKALRSQRQLGGPGYPSTLRRLAELAGNLPLADAVVAMGKPTFREAVVVAANLPKKVTAASGKKFLDAHLTLREDIDRLAGSTQLLECGIQACRKTDDCGFHVDEIATKLLGKAAGNPQSDLRERFVRLTNEKLASHTAPATIGWINEKGKPLLFLAEDLFPKAGLSHRGAGRAEAEEGKRPARESAATPAPAASVPTAVDDRFAEQFDEAFRRLDGEKGFYNFVSLFDLRRALGQYSREQFDRGLKLLRRARRFRINVGEGRSGVSAEQQAAAIIEDGTIHTSVSRIKP